MTLPVALDTNLLVRLLSGDDPEQAGRVAQEELVRQALAWHRQGLDFADALHLLRSEGCARFASLDRALAKAATALDVRPAVQSL